MLERAKDAARVWMFRGNANVCVPGVPARDLTEAEYEEAVATRRIVKGHPSGDLYKKAAAKAAVEKGDK